MLAVSWLRTSYLSSIGGALLVPIPDSFPVIRSRILSLFAFASSVDMAGTSWWALLCFPLGEPVCGHLPL